MSDLIKSNFMKYTYKILSCSITADKKTYNLDPNSGAKITHLMIDHLYMVHTVPYIVTNIQLPFKILEELYNNQNKIKINLDILEIESDINDDIKSKKSFIKKTFEADLTKDKGTVMEDKKASPDDKEIEGQDGIYNAEFILYSTDDINLFKIEDCFIFSKVNAGTALTSFIANRGIKKNVVASVPSITTTKNMMIPMGDLMDNIKYLTMYYGLYPCVPLVYKDIDQFYVINKFDIPIKIGSNKSIIKFIYNDSKTFESGIVDAKTDPNSIIISLKGESHIEPNINMKHVHMSEGANVIAVDTNGKVAKVNVHKNIAKTKVVRKYHELSEKLAMGSAQPYKILNVEMDDVSLSLFKPYIKYMYDKSKDSYFLAACRLELALADEGETYESRATLTLENVEKI